MSDTRAGTVKNIDPLKIILDGETREQQFKKLKGYSPALEERVVCIKHGTSWIVIGGVE